MSIRLCLTGNEPRQKHLFGAIEQIADVKAQVPFDEIDPLTKFVAAGLSFSWPRSEWWENYHMHPLLQRRRRKVLLAGMEPYLHDLDALLMYGSWFHPFLKSAVAIPFFHYIDQSYSLENLPGEPKGRFARRSKAHALQSETYTASAGVFTFSQWARQQTLASHDLPEDKVTAVGWGPCGIDLSNEDPSGEGRAPLVLHVSNDFHRKGVDYIIETADRVHRAVPTARFLVVGKDASGFPVPTNSRVEFTGPLYGKALADVFRQASVFFLPHRFDRSPHVLVEAMSASVPVVASKQGGAIELISGQDIGFLCEPGSIDQYAESIISILQSQELRARMGKNGRALMRSKYNWPAIARRIMDIVSSRVR